MFDPHRTRRSDRRYYTRKGQVLQASRVNVNPTIDQRLVPIYKNYILKNNLVNPPPPSPPYPQTAIKPIGVCIEGNGQQKTYYPFTGFTLSTERTVRLSAGGGGPSACLCCRQRTDGVVIFFVSPFTTSFSYEMTNNVKCYYKYIEIDNPQTFNLRLKSLYHTSPSPENIFLTMDRDDNGNLEKVVAYPQLNITL